MGLTMKEVISSKYFKQCEIIAGKDGLDRKVQAVSLFDAPDGYKWFKGKEFVVTTGYLFKENEGLFKDVVLHLHENNAAGIGIKIKRFLNQIPEEIITLCDELNLPLISLPYDVPWIEVINAVNAVAINKYIFQLNSANKYLERINYERPESAISDIVKSLSLEIGETVMVYDLINNKVSTSSKNSMKNMEVFDLFDPAFNHQKEIMCDKLQICRYSNIEDIDNPNWITIPIIVENNTLAYLVVWESNNRLDYYDLFAIRLCFTLIIYIYKQIYLMATIEGRFQDEFIEELVQGTYKNAEVPYRKAKNLKINLDKQYICILIEQTNNNLHLQEYRERISQKILQEFKRGKVTFGLIEKNKLVVFYDVEENRGITCLQKTIEEKCLSLIKSLEAEIRNSNFIAGVGDSIDYLYSIKSSFIESSKAMDIGRLVYPHKKVLPYRSLGPFGLFRIEYFDKGKLSNLMGELTPLLEQEGSEELVATLKMFLECNSNYNLAAKKLYIHGNTVRYRIKKVQQICNIDLDDPVERLKIEVMLKLL